MKIIWVLLLCFIGTVQGVLGQTVLGPGSMAVVGFNTDDPDRVSVVNLVQVTAGTSIILTDRGWTGTALSSSEGSYTYTFSANTPAGTVTTLNTTGISLSTSGDQIFIIQGTVTAPHFIFGLSTRAWITSGTISASTSYLPPALTSGLNAVSFSVERDNGNYNIIPFSGNANDAAISICNPNNWQRSDTRYTAVPSWIFALNNYASEPSANPGSGSASGITTYAHQLTWSQGSPSNSSYLVVRHTGQATGAPTDGQGYSLGDMIGNGKVAYVGSALTFLQEATCASTQYTYRIFAFQGQGATANYRQSAPLTLSVQTPASMEGVYYQGIDPNLGTFIPDLQARIRNPYQSVDYDNYDETQMAHFAFRDTAGGMRVATCEYSGSNYVYQPPFQWFSASPFSREHVWCHSWMPTYPSIAGNYYDDQHHIFPVDHANANIVRSNHPYGAVNAVTSTFGYAVYGRDMAGDFVYQPMPSRQGDMARAMLYMSLQYHGLGGQNWTFNHLNTAVLPALSEGPLDINLLLAWHAADPPDAYEITRNDYVQSIQMNRNPLIDHPEWVYFIDWGNLQYVPSKRSIDPPASYPGITQVQVYPNPARDRMYLEMENAAPTEVTLEILDAMGKRCFQSQATMEEGRQVAEISIETLPIGTYILVIKRGDTQVIKRFSKI